MGRDQKSISKWSVLLGIAAMWTAAAYGQGTTATISGNVTDTTGASVAGAKVIATNLGTNLVQTATTASDGSYSLLFLPVGNYKVEINATGFKKFDQTGITLDVNGGMLIH